MKEHIQEMIDDQSTMDEKKLKLLQFMRSSEYEKLNVTEKYLVSQQFQCMEKYSDILDLRIMEAS